MLLACKRHVFTGAYEPCRHLAGMLCSNQLQKASICLTGCAQLGNSCKLSLPEQLPVLDAGLALAGAILGPDRHTEGDSGEAAILLDVLESVLDSSTPQRQCAADVQASGSSELGQPAWGTSTQSLTQQHLAGGLTRQHTAGTEAVLGTTLSSLMQAVLALLEAGMGASTAACHMVAEFLQERWLQLAAAGPHVVQSTLLVSTRVLH